MITELSPTLLHEARSEARRLLASLRADDAEICARAALRFLRLRSFANLSASQLLGRRERVRLKHALAAVAHERGFSSWLALKAAAAAQTAAETTAEAKPSESEVAEVPMYERAMDCLLNRWFTRYPDARASLEREGGYLLPYRHQFLVVESEGIRVLGLDPDDEDWRRIGRDWAQPADAAAFDRLKRKRERVLAAAASLVSAGAARPGRRDGGASGSAETSS